MTTNHTKTTMKAFSDEKRIKDKKRYCFVPRRLKDETLKKSIKIKIPLEVFNRVERLAQYKKICFSNALVELLNTEEAKTIWPPSPKDVVQIIRAAPQRYSSFDFTLKKG